LELSSIQLENDDQLIISGGQLSSGHLSSDERLTLQSREELIALLSLLITKKPLRIFEFGLMRGGSLLHFYLNTSEKVKIDSLDCNLKNLTPYVQSIISLNNRITIHEQNSLDFDETPFKSLIDFIFIDGGHEYNIVKNDTEKAFFMLSSSGTIVWDDYSPHFPGVYNFINELSIEHKGLKQIKGTSLVYIEKIKQ
jgi:predicted O-methyltransferase YrrM